MWNQQLALNDVAGQTDAWLSGQQGRSVKPLGFYAITKTLSETRGIVCMCQRSSLLIIQHVPTSPQDYCAVMGHLSVVFSFSFPVSQIFMKHFNMQDICSVHSSFVLSVDVGIWYKFSVFMELGKFPFWQ